MKKIFTLVCFALVALSTSAQEYNLFPAEDVDAEGWLWFNTQEKINKYVGVIDEDNYAVNPNGKVIQMAYANITPEYPETTADPEVLGVDKAGKYIDEEGCNKDEIIKGAIVLAKASGTMGTMNGGSLVLNLPSCSTISLYLSSEGSVFGRTLMLTAGKDFGTDDSEDQNWTGSTKSIYSKASMFSTICNAGHYKWEGVEKANNGYNQGLTFVSDSPVYFCFQNCRNRTIYIHGIKVTTPKQETLSIQNVAAEKADAAVYDLQGRRVNGSAFNKGLYIQNGKKFVVK